MAIGRQHRPGKTTPLLCETVHALPSDTRCCSSGFSSGALQEFTGELKKLSNNISISVFPYLTPVFPIGLGVHKGGHCVVLVYSCIPKA